MRLIPIVVIDSGTHLIPVSGAPVGMVRYAVVVRGTDSGSYVEVPLADAYYYKVLDAYASNILN
jgi:hypothetical protein